MTGLATLEPATMGTLLRLGLRDAPPVNAMDSFHPSALFTVHFTVSPFLTTVPTGRVDIVIVLSEFFVIVRL
jgi:hypothetical protein